MFRHVGLKEARDNCTNRQGNEGFTLLEVLIAMIILAIACIPVIHAFVTAANTNSKSKLKMYATNAAQTVMEHTRNTTIDDFLAYWGIVGAPDAAGRYAPVTIDDTVTGALSSAKRSANSDLIEAVEDKGFKVEIEFDPQYYPNTNSFNLSHFDAVSDTYSAIYAMNPETDQKAYEEFALRNERFRDNPACMDSKIYGAEYYQKKLKREIRVDIKKKGSFELFEDKDGTRRIVKDVNDDPLIRDKVTVDISVSYYLDEPDSIGMTSTVEPSERFYQAVSRQVFSNISSERELRSIFILYYPRYIAADPANFGGNGDNIIIHNDGAGLDALGADAKKSEIGLYVVAQNPTGSDWEQYIKKSANAGLNLYIYSNDHIKGQKPLKLLTNLVDEKTVLNSRTAGADVVPVCCFLRVGDEIDDFEGADDNFGDVFKKFVNRKGSFPGTLSYKKKADGRMYVDDLRTDYFDGKTLDVESIMPRLYDVSVKVSNDLAGSAAYPVEVTLKGTMLLSED